MRTIDLGQWPQGSGGEACPIPWYVLREDAYRLFLHCGCGLWSMAYDAAGRKVFWETSPIREWLDELYRQAFSDGEKERINEALLKRYLDQRLLRLIYRQA